MKARKLLLAVALAAGTAFAQQNVDISGKDFESGAGDARFASIGRQAAASGKRIVVTAPQQWHGKIAAKIRAGGAADVVLKDGFYENVLVRVEEKPAEPPKPEPKAEARVEPKAAPKTVARVPDEVPGPKPTLPPPVATTEPAPIVAPRPAPIATPAPKPVAPAPATPAASQVATRAPAAAAPAKPDIAGIQKRLETSLNNGRAAEGPISVSALQPGDFIFVDGPVRAVVRRESLRPRMFWLDGELELRRTELKELATNKYQVIEPLHGEIYSLREERADQAKTLVATEPPDNSPVRATLERDYNDGHPIAAGIAIEKLRSGDIVYAGKGTAVVVRREGQSLTRYWLEGTLDLGQSGLQKDGANKYKVVSDTLR
jgi:hypothetical protein